MTSYYGFTIKCIKAQYQATTEELKDIMIEMLAKHKAQYVDHFSEYDSLGRVHIHGTFMARKGILLSLFKKPFHTIHIDYLPTMNDVENWAQYIRSDQDGFKTFYGTLQNGEYLFQK